MKTKSYAAARRVVVTGLGIIAPNGIGVQRFWENALAGRSGIYAIDTFPTEGFKSKIAGQVRDFDPMACGLREDQARRLDRYAQFAVAASIMAIKDAGIDVAALVPEKCGVCIGNAICGTAYMEQEFLAVTERGRAELRPELVNSCLYQNSTFNAASSEVASLYGMRGNCFTMSTGCTGGLDAIGAALDAIRDGDVDLMICGASEAPITPVAMGAFDVVGALSSKRNDTPSRASRPFDGTRDGFVLGEGAGILILEEREHALRRNARIYAELRGFGSCNNAFHMTDLPPDGKDLARALRLALADARITPQEVDYVCGHGSSTRQNDTNETAALKIVFGDHAYKLAVNSLKGMVGHPLAAANALEAVASVLSIHTGMLFPTINYEVEDPTCDLFYVPNEAIQRDVKVVVKDASGFSGIHSALIFTSPDYAGDSQ
ncbi:beta-ketoacyl-[acyl-carrier-protein] synthase family protein [Polyangium jinanense]|uniref:Beta-ketoacyl-[acyl-carrier-protein] synthase family protein n=1 Tax=Polyangium jinanense TaxID=2829994 RepID=A0A9X3XFY7_9BACT|nr:beta-ketoacyl-[acyl-carrier-protein] synthase family protein [Polyangium jinanense]MDC3962400.1 beta-ketoacyl-[acyl-carrier-protein] synthase family protein [Polyangium jinanense]MDC3989292.1 beta-ketoacyl-[acyl-carrier-protein] synthase family protein [Polyangium jinanense]